MQKWAEIIGQARQSVDFLKDPEVVRVVLNILQVVNLVYLCTLTVSLSMPCAHLTLISFNKYDWVAGTLRFNDSISLSVISMMSED